MTTAAAEKRAATNLGTEPAREVVPPLRQRIAFVSGGMGGIGSAPAGFSGVWHLMQRSSANSSRPWRIRDCCRRS